jgi:hypothetical protein
MIFGKCCVDILFTISFRSNWSLNVQKVLATAIQILHFSTATTDGIFTTYEEVVPMLFKSEDVSNHGTC